MISNSTGASAWRDQWLRLKRLDPAIKRWRSPEGVVRSSRLASSEDSGSISASVTTVITRRGAGASRVVARLRRIERGGTVLAVAVAGLQY